MKLVFLSKNEEVKDVSSFVFEPQEPISWQPGQYMHYDLPLQNPDEKGAERWFTISSAPYENNIRITTRLDNGPVSSFKQYLLDLKPGDSIEGDGPKGSFKLKEAAKSHIMISGGIGITPYRSMLAQLAHERVPTHATLLYANRGDQFVFNDELEAIASQDTTLKVIKFVDKRITEEDLRPLVSEDTIFYLSGPRGMVENYEQLLPTLGASKEQIITDYFPGY